MSGFRRAFLDFHSTTEEQIAEGDKVVTRWTIRGTHQGEFRGIATTGKQITVRGIGIFRFSEEGKVVESRLLSEAVLSDAVEVFFCHTPLSP